MGFIQLAARLRARHDIVRFFRDASADLASRRFDLGLAFAHTLGLTISFALPLLQVASIVLMLTRPRGEGLSDLVLGTVALNRRAAM